MVGDLPSGEHAAAFIREPSPGGAALLGVDVVVRAALIAIGLTLATRKPTP